ncbi:hypothetical protein AS156_01695 [Bradyrhizobium macuxiense]|uniref:Uncharacterized protein n=1 Tax=Bradyrhizobium macuxiense TaxID=1755647 RepID=A0A109JCQ8_9BRAD|nr:hypothetical protein AS156_01695 [Bradyrhizobium macuxiense]
MPGQDEMDQFRAAAAQFRRNDQSAPALLMARVNCAGLPGPVGPVFATLLRVPRQPGFAALKQRL